MLQKYLKEIANTTIQGDAREESYYQHLSDLVKDISNSIGKTTYPFRYPHLSALT